MNRLVKALLPLLLASVTSACNKTEKPEAAPPAATVQAEPAASPPELLPASGPSLYELDLQLVDQDGQATTLDAFAGRPVIVTMFYASCPVACPMLISDIKVAVKRASKATQSELGVILVSLDPERDTPEKLKQLAERHSLDTPAWRFTRTSEGSTRELAAVLGVKYTKLESGAIRHTSLISVLDRRGVVRYRAQSPVPAEDRALSLALDAVRKSEVPPQPLSALTAQ